MEEKKTLTYEELMAGFAETNRTLAEVGKRQEESMKNYDRIDKQHEEAMKRYDRIDKRHEEAMKRYDKIDKRHEEAMKRYDKIDKLQEENARGFAELRKLGKECTAQIKELGKQMSDTRRDVYGIAESNGKFSETYFYNTLLNSMRFGGKDFDEIDKGLKRSKKMPDGDKLKGEYDVVMYNGNTIALIEVKYKVRKNHIDNLTTKQVSVFRKLFPQYANFDFYLGIAGLSFEDDTEKEALERGIGILKPKGESVEIIDDNLKAY